MDTNIIIIIKYCFIVYIKTNDNYKDIAEDIETGFDISNYELNRPLPTEKNKNRIILMEDECLFFSALKCLYFSFTFSVFSLFLLQKVFDIFQILLFRVFLCVFDNTYVAFYIYTKKIIKKYKI